MAEVNFPVNQLRETDPQRAAAFERAVREAIGMHKGRYDARILVGSRGAGDVLVQVEQPALQTDASAEVTGTGLIGKPARAWTWPSPQEAQTPEAVRDVLAAELRNHVRGRGSRVPLKRGERPMYRSKHGARPKKR